MYLNYIIRKCLTNLLLPFRIFPIHQDRIVFISLEGGTQCEYACNPKYFCEYLLKTRPDKYKIVWLLRHPEKYNYLQQKGIIIAKHFTLKGIYYALTSHIVLSNGGYFAWFPFRKEQICINTWHGGGAYKKLENDMKNANTITNKRMEFASRNIDAYISSCEQFTKHVIRKAFLYKGTVLPIGTPRNDLFFSEQKNFYYKKIREHYHIPSESRIVIYIPTFRSNRQCSYEKPDAVGILNTLSKKTGETWYFLNHSHIKSYGSTVPVHTNSYCIDVSEYPDTQELLCAADWMISDYSSVIWDYCLMKRPILLYTPDLESYISTRGFYIDIREWGFPICRNMEELLDAICAVSNDSVQCMSVHHTELLGSYEKGHACAELLTYIEGISTQ